MAEEREELEEEVAQLIDMYLGEAIEEVVGRYYEDQVDLEADYEDLVEFMASEIVKGLGEADPSYYEAELRKLRRAPGVSKALVSYLVSKYIDARGANVGGKKRAGSFTKGG
ncbi:MAG: hypothetical protein ABWK00_04920 [Desulfurococcaceae archaeon]